MSQPGLKGCQLIGIGAALIACCQMRGQIGLLIDAAMLGRLVQKLNRLFVSEWVIHQRSICPLSVLRSWSCAVCRRVCMVRSLTCSTCAISAMGSSCS